MQLVFPRGFSANCVLLIWGLFGSVLVYAFLANFRTMLLMPVLEKPVDTAQDILDRGMIPFVIDGGQFYVDVLKESPNPVYQQLAGITVIPDNYNDWLKMFKDDVQDANSVG